MKIRLTKNRVAFCLLAGLGLLLLAACFQPVDIGETFVEKGTAHLRVTNDSEDESYILEGLELRNAGGEIEQSWEGLDLKAGGTWEVHTETSGSFTLWYRVKDTWISSTAINLWEKGPVDIVLNKSHEFSFNGKDVAVSPRDGDRDGVPDIWEAENGFDPEDNSDGGMVYVSGNGEDTNKGTRDSPYKTLAKAVEKARRGLDDSASTVVVLGTLNWLNGNDRNPENQARADSLFVLGKTRNPLTIRGEDLDDPEKAGVLQGNLLSGKRVLYIGPGADVTLLNITITGGKHTGGGIYASGPALTLTLGKGTTVTKNESFDVNATNSGGLYMERGVLVMEAGSSISDNEAYTAGGLTLIGSRLTMDGGAITENRANWRFGGLDADESTIEMYAGAEISKNTAGKEDNTTASVSGGAVLAFSKLTMYPGSKISENKAVKGWVGGLRVTGESTLIMKGGEISGNECTYDEKVGMSGNAGGVAVVARSSFTMEGGIIASNTAKQGGGIFLASGALLTIQGGTVYGKDASDNTLKNVADTGKGCAISDTRPLWPHYIQYETNIKKFPLQ